LYENNGVVKREMVTEYLKKLGQDERKILRDLGVKFGRLDDKNKKNKKFMLLCGFENFDNYFVRIDILERLFVLIINASPEKVKEIKLVPEMLNLLGCSKDNFKKLIEKMNYKTLEKDNDIYFRYNPKKQIKKTFKKIDTSNSPFKILKNLNLN